MIIGVISDTHGLLRPEALAALQGSDYIIHAGDVGDPQILNELAAIAPLTAVRGNVDHGHTHVPKRELKNGVLYFNPGSAGPRRFNLPVSVGRLHLTNGGLESEI